MKKKNIKNLSISLASTLAGLALIGGVCTLSPVNAVAETPSKDDLFTSWVTPEYTTNGATFTTDNTQYAETKGNAFDVQLNGLFNDDVTIDFEMPEEYNTIQTGKFFMAFRVADAKDSTEYFDVVWNLSVRVNGFTQVYVVYQDEVRTNYCDHTTLSAIQNSFISRNMFYCPTSNTKSNRTTEWVDNTGSLKLDIDANNVLSVAVKHYDGTYPVLAKFDGTKAFNATSLTYGLPKLSFEDGYTVTYKSFYADKEAFVSDFDNKSDYNYTLSASSKRNTGITFTAITTSSQGSVADLTANGTILTAPDFYTQFAATNPVYEVTILNEDGQQIDGNSQLTNQTIKARGVFTLPYAYKAKNPTDTLAGWTIGDDLFTAHKQGEVIAMTEDIVIRPYIVPDIDSTDLLNTNAGLSKNANGVTLQSATPYSAQLENVFTGNTEITFSLDGSFKQWNQQGLQNENIFNIRVQSISDVSAYFDISFMYINAAIYKSEGTDGTYYHNALTPVLYYQDGVDLRTRFSNSQMKTGVLTYSTEVDEFLTSGNHTPSHYGISGKSGSYILASEVNGVIEEDVFKDFVPEIATDIYAKDLKIAIEWENGNVLTVSYYRTVNGVATKYALAKFDDYKLGCNLPSLEKFSQGYTIAFESDSRYVSTYKYKSDSKDYFGYYNQLVKGAVNMKTNLTATLSEINYTEKDVTNTIDFADEDFKIPTSWIKYQQFVDGACAVYIDNDTSYNNIGVGSKIVIPKAIWENYVGESGDIEKATLIYNGTSTQVNVGDDYTISGAGDYEIIYKTSGNENSFKFTAVEYALEASKVFSGDVTTYQGWNGLAIHSSDNSYSAQIAGVFQGDNTIQFSIEEFWSYFTLNPNDNIFAFKVASASNPNQYFRVLYKIPNVNEVKSFAPAIVYHTEDGNIIYRGSDGTYNYSKWTGENWGFKPNVPSLSRWSTAKISFAFEDDVLTIQAEKTNGKMATIGVFDGTYGADKELFGFDTGAQNWGLPKMDISAGYTIAIETYRDNEYTGAVNPYDISLVAVNGKSLKGVAGIVYAQPTCQFVVENAVEDNGVFYATQGKTLKAKAVYTSVLAQGTNGAWVDIVEEDITVDGLTASTVVNEKQLTFTSTYHQAVHGLTVTENKKLTVEQPFTLNFNTSGGNVIAPIKHSAHFASTIVVPTPVRAFWEFTGWTLDGSAWDGNIDSLAGRNTTLIATWKDAMDPTVYVKEPSITKKQNEGLLVSLDDVIAKDENGEVTVTYKIKKPGETVFGLTVNSGYTLELTQVGEYVIEYTVTDAVGKTDVAYKRIQVFKNNLPTITFKGSYATEFMVNQTVTLAEVVAKAGDGTTIPVNTVKVFKDGLIYVVENGKFTIPAVGQYTVTYYVQDNAGGSVSLSYTFTAMADNIAPTITTTFKDIAVKKGSTVTIPSISVTDNATSGIKPSITVTYGVEKIVVTNNKFVVSQPGIYKVQIDAFDAAGNRATKTVEITVPMNDNPSGSIQGGSNQGGNNQGGDKTKVGCGSDLNTGSTIVFILTVVTVVAVFLIRKRKETANEQEKI